MADVIVEARDRYTFSAINRTKVILLGLFLGLAVFVLTWLLGNYVVELLFCRGESVGNCQNTTVLAGNIAAIIAAVAGTVMLSRYRVRRAIWVALAALITLWNIALVTDGLHAFEIMLWLAGLYMVGYLLFSTIFRLRSMFVAICLAILVILVFRWVAFL